MCRLEGNQNQAEGQALAMCGWLEPVFYLALPQFAEFDGLASRIRTAVQAKDWRTARQVLDQLEEARKRFPEKDRNGTFFPRKVDEALELEQLVKWNSPQPGEQIPGLRATYFNDSEFKNKLREDIVSRLSWHGNPVNWDGNPRGLPAPGKPNNGYGCSDYFSCVYEGVLLVERAGTYELHLCADDGGKLFLDEKLAIDTNNAEKSAKMELATGLHPLRITMFQHSYFTQLRFNWTPPGGKKEVVPLSALRFIVPPAQDKK